MRGIVVLYLALLALAPDLRTSCDRMRDAVTRYDVNASIPREDVKRWNEVIRASRMLRKAAGCQVS